MFHRIVSGMLPAIFLMAFSQASGQDQVLSHTKEFHFGMGLNKRLEASPRIMYKTVRGEKATRLSLQFSFRTRIGDQNTNYSTSDLSDQSLTTQSTNIALGWGKEYRVPIGNGFRFYGAWEVAGRYVLGHGSNQIVLSDTTQRSTERIVKSTLHTPGIDLNGFVGFRFDPHPRISFSAEVGPTLRTFFQVGKGTTTAITDRGTPNEYVETRNFSSSSFNVQMQFLSPLFIQVAYHF